MADVDVSKYAVYLAVREVDTWGTMVPTSVQGIHMFVQAREGESFEELYRRFKRGIEASGLLREYRRKQRFIPAHEERRDKIRSAARKLRRAQAKRQVR